MDDFKAPCYGCNNRRIVKLGPDDKLYCEMCNPGLFMDDLMNKFTGDKNETKRILRNFR